MKRALITGATGQDGSYLSELLLSAGYEVYGLVRRTSQPHRVVPGVNVVEGDVDDFSSVLAAVSEIRPREVYNLAAQSFVGASFAVPLATFRTNAEGALNVLESVRRGWPAARVYQAGTSEQFGGIHGSVALSETTPFHPRSPYGVAKTAAFHAAVHYRERGLFVSNGILFNHESPRRGEQFLTRKVSKYVGALRRGESLPPLALGDLSPVRDWGFAGDYVRAMHLMLRSAEPDDFVVATGVPCRASEFVAACFGVAGLDWTRFVVRDPDLNRPTEVPHLLGDASKIRTALRWEPTCLWPDLARIMVEADT